MEHDTTLQAVQFWLTVKTLMQKLEDARQSAIAGFIDAAIKDPATARGDPSLGAGWKTKLDAAEKPLNDQLAPLASVLSETESHLAYLFSKDENEVEEAFHQIAKDVSAEEHGRKKLIEKFLTELKTKSAATPTKVSAK